MPAHNLSFIIGWKEFREIFRDKRTIMSVVVGPLLITPALFALVGLGINKKVDEAKSQMQSITVPIVGTPEELDTVKSLLGSPAQIKLQAIPTEEEATQRIKKREIPIALRFESNANAQAEAEKPITVTIYSDPGDEKSRMVAGAFQSALRKIGDGKVQERLQKRSLDIALLKPFEIKEKTVPGSGGTGMLMLTQMLPYMLILAAFSGSIYAAFDQVAGEKERGTLETLLISPASRRDIVLGKFGAVVCVCILTSILSIVGMIIPFASGLKAFEWLSKGGLQLSAGAIATIGVTILPLSVLFAGILLALSTFARNQKEAQTYLGSLFPIILVPAMFSMFVDTKASIAYAFAPILNASVIIKQALNGSFNLSFIAVAFVVSVLYAGIALTFATRLFQKESVLIKA